MKDGVARRGRELRHHARQIVERALAGDQDVERRIGEHRQRQLHASPRVPPRALRRGDRTDLRRLDRQPACVERFTEPYVDRLIPVPAHLDDDRLERREAEREAQAGGRSARVHDQVGAAARGVRRREPHAEGARDGGARRIHVHQLDVAAAHASGEPRDEAADGARADHGDAIADRDRRVPHTVDRGLEVGREHRARRRYALRHQMHGVGRDHVSRLMRVERERGAAGELPRTVLDRPDACVPVFHRRRKTSRLKRRGHALALAGRHAALEHERLGPAADAAEQRAHDDLIRGRRRQRLAPQLSTSRRGNPERTRLIRRHGS